MPPGLWVKAKCLAAAWGPEHTQNAASAESATAAAHQSVKGIVETAWRTCLRAPVPTSPQRSISGGNWFIKSNKVSYKLGIPPPHILHLVKVHLLNESAGHIWK